jgi:hypothetical protein
MPERDHYEIYYADKLWALLPGVYRAEDSAIFDRPGPLRELVNRLGSQAAILRRSIDRLLEDQSIESCDDWIIPYIADLLATNLVASLDARGQRIDVAKTIYYRRRKGTVAILEEIAADITGWEARVVEFFRRMARTRHGIDPPIDLPVGDQFPDPLQKAQGLIGTHSHTAMGGWADLRNRYGAQKAHTAFDEFFHLADLRRGQGQTGWHNIPRVGVFLWRLKSFGVDHTTPVPVAGCPNWYTFDPTGRDIPLFAAASRKETKGFGDRWVSPEEFQLPMAIGEELWGTFRSALYPNPPDALRSLGVFLKPGIAGYVLVNPADVDVYPERGRFKVHNPPVTGTVFGTYHYGFSSFIGAGPYDRRTRGDAPLPASALQVISGGGALNALAAGTTSVEDSLTYVSNADLAGITKAAIVAKNEKRPALRLPAGGEWKLEGAAGAELTLEGLLVSGGDIVLRGEFESVTLRCTTLDPGASSAPTAVFQTAADSRPLAPVRLWIEGKVRNLTIERSIVGPIRTRHNGILEEVVVSDSVLQAIRTADFGPLAEAEIKDSTALASLLQDARTPLAKSLNSSFAPALQAQLTAYKSDQPPAPALVTDLIGALNAAIAGPLLFKPPLFAGMHLSQAVQALIKANPAGPELAKLNRLLLEEAFPLELADAAVALADGGVRLSRVTVLGRLNVHRLQASECILDDFAVTGDPQSGCVRFSAWSTGSVLPRKYESVRVPAAAPLFTTRVFGQPGYAQLTQNADRAIAAPATDGSILEGAQNGSEMGAFYMEKNAIKERSLRIKYEEFMPLGLIPVVNYVT